MPGTSAILAGTLVSECPIPADLAAMRVGGEEAVAAYKTLRDTAIFTTRRLDRPIASAVLAG